MQISGGLEPGSIWDQVCRIHWRLIVRRRSPEGGPDRGVIFQPRILGHFFQNLWTARVHFCKLRRSLSPVPSAGDCTQLTTLLLLAHAACPQQDCPLFVRHSKIVHATCDVVRGLCSLSEGSARRDRKWNANGGSVGQFLNKAGSVGRVKAEVVGEVVDNDYNLEKLVSFFRKCVGFHCAAVFSQNVQMD